MAPEPMTEAELFQDRLDEAYRQITTLQQEKAALEGERDEALAGLRVADCLIATRASQLAQAKAAVVAMAEGESQVVEGLKADNRRLREALEAAFQMVSAVSTPRVDIATMIAAALAATPEGEK